MSGLTADARTMIDRARVEAQNHWFTYNEQMRVASVTQAVCNLAMQFGEGDEAEHGTMVSGDSLFSLTVLHTDGLFSLTVLHTGTPLRIPTSIQRTRPLCDLPLYHRTMSPLRAHG